MVHYRSAMLDMPEAKLHLRASMQGYVDKVDLRMAPDDRMDTDDIHYLEAGSSALNVIKAALRLIDVESPTSILDFGSGAGRVTRWLKAAYPHASLACTDLRPQDVDFCREVFQAEAWVSSTDIGMCEFRGPHDLIWMGSVLTHLDEARSRLLVERAMAALTAGGLLVATTIGRVARATQNQEGAYLTGPDWPIVTRGYDEIGYGYTDYETQKGYGLSLSSPAWVTSLATAVSGRRLVMISEAAWDGTQDVFALQVAPSFRADPKMPSLMGRKAVGGRVAASGRSTSGRLPRLLRRLATTLMGRRS